MHSTSGRQATIVGGQPGPSPAPSRRQPRPRSPSIPEAGPSQSKHPSPMDQYSVQTSRPPLPSFKKKEKAQLKGETDDDDAPAPAASTSTTGAVKRKVTDQPLPMRPVAGMMGGLTKKMKGKEVRSFDLVASFLRRLIQPSFWFPPPPLSGSDDRVAFREAQVDVYIIYEEGTRPKRRTGTQDVPRPRVVEGILQAKQSDEPPDRRRDVQDRCWEERRGTQSSFSSDPSDASELENVVSLRFFLSRLR